MIFPAMDDVLECKVLQSPLSNQWHCLIHLR